MSENTFSYTYSAKENAEIKQIRDKYIDKPISEFDKLKELDAKVKRPANIFGYAFGSISAIVMGGGMSLVMSNIGNTIGLTDAFIPGLAISVAGLIMCLINYPIYKSILDKRKQKYAKDIIALSDKLSK